MGAPRAASVCAVGRLGDQAEPWFGIADTPTGHRLVFGMPGGRLTYPTGDGDGERECRDLLLSVAAFFEGEAGDPPPELEATHSDTAAALRWLVSTVADADDSPRLDALRRALDAIDDGMPPDVVVGYLYKAMGAVSLDERPRPGFSTLEELLERYRSVEG